MKSVVFKSTAKLISTESRANVDLETKTMERAAS
jgi:hypothetical protein